MRIITILNILARPPAMRHFKLLLGIVEIQYTRARIKSGSFNGSLVTLENMKLKTKHNRDE